ncbi:hypothetical protein [Novosphingobium guangzhouense]|uniref:Energy transducer TonB n=1 Tax=Novosphingobium guangzhouense TaxID=1850347 RepID=A0A2K2FUJ8_9SPHN|nr:hypothetical protein [Novosphingobium guangzhouense]PNU02461.1 hypothetical protein A8V01_08730 [Novosphingobium guangzhouense]
MAILGVRKEERAGFVVAVLLHGAVLAAILYSPRANNVVKPPERIEVTISDDVAMTSTAPNPGEASPDKSPEVGQPAPEAAPSPPEPAPAPEPEPAPAPEPAPRVVEKPKPQPKPEPKPVPKPKPKPVEKPKPAPPKPAPPKPAPPKPAAKPAPKAPPRKSSAIDDIVRKPSPKPAPAGKTSGSSNSATPPKKAGSSAFDDAFKSGTPGATSSAPKQTGTPAAAIGASARSALGAAINRQLKPHWQAPQGADVELLVTKVRFRLNRDGSLAGAPEVIGTSGVQASNRAQVERHQEQAVRAVRLAAPFELPDDLYDGWKVVTTTFDRRLSQ